MLIGCLDFCNLVNVLESYCTSNLVARTASTFFNSGGLFEKIGCRRGFSDEGESAVRLHGYKGRNRDTRFYM